MNQTFAVDSPEGLPILADWLADQGRSGEVLVRWLVRWNRFPHGKFWTRAGKKTSWFPLSLNVSCSGHSNEVPREFVISNDSGGYRWEWFDTPSEAIWTLIERYEQNPVALPEE